MSFRCYNTLVCHEQTFQSVSEAYKLWYHSCRHSALYTFYLFDIPNDILIPFQSKEELMLWWSDHHPAVYAYQAGERWVLQESLNPLRFEKVCTFDDLNITGKDTRTSYSFDAGGNEVLHVWSRNTQILDSDFRPVDIREWFDLPEEKIHAILHTERNRERKELRACQMKKYPGHNGRKCHWVRVSGPSMYRGTARNAERASWEQGYQGGLQSGLQSGSQSGLHLIRQSLMTEALAEREAVAEQEDLSERGIPVKRSGLSSDDMEDYVERKVCHGHAVHSSWKDQGKYRRQYMKHLPKCHDVERIRPKNSCEFLE